jgi:two-component system chemotaxis sensor kinase CheA
MPKPERHLTLPGSLTVAVCETLQADLAAALDEADDIVVDVDPDAETDLSFLQLLVAAERSAHARGKRVALSAPPAGVFAEAIRVCGFAAAPGAVSLSQIFAPQGGRA